MCKTARAPRGRRSPFHRVPEDVVVEILVRVPATCVVHLKRVCRSWRILISRPEFAQYHFERSTSQGEADARLACAGMFPSERRIGFLSLQSLFHDPSAAAKVACVQAGRQYYIIGSCNGLLCLYDSVSKSSVMLWNPCTGYTSEWLHTTARIRTSGFGYDHVNHMYKLFALLQLKSGAFISKIFTFGMNHWKTIENCPSLLVKDVSLRGVFVSGTLYWLVRVPHVVIVYLDMGSETYGELSLPHRDPDDDFRIIPAIGVLRNCLSLCSDHKKTHWAVWLLNNQSWTKLAMIPQNSLSTGDLKLCLRPLYITEDDVLLVLGQDRKLHLVYLNDGRIVSPLIDSSSDDAVERPMSPVFGRITEIVYYPSLVSPSRMVHFNPTDFGVLL